MPAAQLQDDVLHTGDKNTPGLAVTAVSQEPGGHELNWDIQDSFRELEAQFLLNTELGTNL